MASVVPLSIQAQNLQRELEVTLLKLESLALLRPDAADHIRTLVAEDIAEKCEERYRLYPCGPRQELLQIRRNALAPTCPLQLRLKEYSAGGRSRNQLLQAQLQAQQQAQQLAAQPTQQPQPSPASQQQQPQKTPQKQQQHQTNSRNGSQSRNWASVRKSTSSICPLSVEKTATSTKGVRIFEAEIWNWIAETPTESSSTTSSPQKKGDQVIPEVAMTEAKSVQLDGVLVDVCLDVDPRPTADPGCNFLEEAAGGVSAENQPQNGDDDGNGSNEDRHGSPVILGQDVESKGTKEQEEDALSWLGLPPTKAAEAEVDENEDLIDLGC